MQENLDVLISFVIVIVGLSVLVQIVVEMFKNLFKIRWGVYEKFLKELYKDYFYESAVPTTPAANTESRPTPPNTKGQTKPKGFFGKIKDREKIGSITQRLRSLHDKVVSFIEDLNKLKATLFSLKKNLDNQRYQFDLASLRDLLNDLDIIRQRLLGKQFARLFEIYLQAIDQNIVNDYNKMINEVDDILKLDIKKVVVESITETIDKLVTHIHSVEKFVQEYQTKISANIDSWLQDLSNRYSRSIAKISFFIGCFVVITLNADTIAIYRTLRDEPAVRQNLIQQSEEFSKITQPSVNADDINKLNSLAERITNKLEPNEKVAAQDYRMFVDRYGSLMSSQKQGAESYNQVYQKIEHSERITITLPYPPEKTTQGLFVQSEKLVKDNKPLTESQIEAVTSEINGAVTRVTANYLAFQHALVRNQNVLLHSTGLPLGWTGGRLDLTFGSFWSFCVKFIGLLITAILISFGAPFWNDVLKSLFGIRSLLRKQDLTPKAGT
ncbi:MAG: hypothetical protein ACYTBZ_27235 [Planctomycetota bacterium]|jgi:hypothetical protein